MKPTRRVLAVAGDQGGAAALAPVLHSLASDPSVTLSVFGYLQALDVWRRAGLAVFPIPPDPQVAVPNIFRRADCDLVIAGTSVNAWNWERLFVRSANEIGVHTLAILDYWSNYRERFGLGDDGGLSMPSTVAVMDEFASSEMVTQGFPANRIVVTGHPGLDLLHDFRKRWTEEDRTRVRRAMGAEEGDCVVLFASQPMAELAGLLPHQDALYDEHLVLVALAESLDRLSAAKLLRGTRLRIRPHPRQRMSKAELPSPSHVDTQFSPGLGPWAEVLAADMVVGMTTMLLVEACALGCKVLSIQPGCEGTDSVPTNRSGASLAVYDLRELDRAVLERWSRPAPSPDCAPSPLSATRSATSKVLSLISTLLTEGSPS